MSRRLGQNFLITRRQRERILDELAIEPKSLVWEIGPGIGAMTGMALDRGCRLATFEIDHGFARILRRLYGTREGFSLVEGDFLDTAPLLPEAERNPDRIFGNLPYSVANVIIAAILESGRVPPRMAFTVQKEAARRICAGPGTKDYSAFSVLCSSVCTVKTIFDIGASSFWPVPSVTSSLVIFKPRPDPLHAQDRRGFSNFVRTVFAHRRKTMRNALKSWSRLSPVPEGSSAAASFAPSTPPAPPGLPTDPSGASSQTAAALIADTSALLETLLAGMGKPLDARAEILRPEELAYVYGQLLAAT